MKEFDIYQEFAKTTAVFPRETALQYLALGLTGEAGEVANKLKKRIRGDEHYASNQEVAKELGDILWYVAVLADELGVSLSEIATNNYEKLSIREANNTIKGSGDDR